MSFIDAIYTLICPERALTTTLDQTQKDEIEKRGGPAANEGNLDLSHTWGTYTQRRICRRAAPKGKSYVPLFLIGLD